MGCPTRKQLLKFITGQLPETALADVAEHLEHCANCSAALEALEAERDVARARLRDPEASAAFQDEPECHRALARLCLLIRSELRLASSDRPPPGGTEGRVTRPTSAPDRAAAVREADDRATHPTTALDPPSMAPRPDQPPARLAPRLGEYELLTRIGHGGMGEVYKARHPLMGRTVALKVIRPDRLQHPESVARFEREIRAAAQLDHPNIVRAYDASQVGGTHFLVMEYVEGMDLAQLVRQRGPLPAAEACGYVYQAALALDHVHRHGLVHRDVKPANLMLTAAGQVKLLDLGLTRARGDQPADEELTHTGVFMGTVDFTAPEQWEDARAVDIRADVYSLGCTLYYLLTGAPPFSDAGPETLLSKRAAHAHAPPPPIAQRATVPAAVEAVYQRCLQKDPSRRFSGPGELAEDLRRCLEAFRPPAPPAGKARRLLAGLVTWLSGRRPRRGGAPQEGAGGGQAAGRLLAEGEVQYYDGKNARCLVNLDGLQVPVYLPAAALRRHRLGENSRFLWDMTEGGPVRARHIRPVPDPRLAPEERQRLAARYQADVDDPAPDVWDDAGDD